jgi:hypothetical protein
VPGTVLSDQYGQTSIAEALDELSSRDPSIEAVGITDYATTASFRRATEAWEAGAGQGIKLLFPNIELRLDLPTTKGSGVNLHLLCSPDEIEEVDRFLRLVEFSFRDRQFQAERSSLIALGRAVAQDGDLDEVAALREGTTQFKVNFGRFRQRYQEDAWAREHCLVGFAGGQQDGTSGVRASGGGFEAQRQEIERFAHIIFSGNPQQRAFWLGNGADTPEQLAAKYGGRKLCLHGSDGHDLAQLGVPAQKRYCWLRGDTSFETLQQACIEPATRAFIGSDRPGASQAQGRLTRLTVTSPGWFPEQPMPINAGLVAIIGARGSGKTALADLLAVGAGSNEPCGNPSSFVRRADDLINDAAVATEWTDGAITTQSLVAGLVVDASEPPPVRYLSQQFVEQLCAVDGVSDKLRYEIERVVFNSWPVEHRLGATDFDQLLALRLQTARSQQQAELDSIANLTIDISTQRLLKESLPELRGKLEAHEKELTQLQRESTDLTRKTDRTRAERLAAVSNALEEREQDLQAVERMLVALRALHSDVQIARSTKFPRHFGSLREEHSGAGLASNEWDQFKIDFAGDVNELINRHREATEARRTAIAGSVPDEASLPQLADLDVSELSQRTVAELRGERGRLQRLVGLDEQRTKRLTVITDKASQTRSAMTRLRETLADAQQAGERIDRFSTKRLDHYESYFDALLTEESELNELYRPLDRILSSGHGSISRLRFVVRRSVDIPEWAARGEALLDLRTEGPFRGHGKLADLAASDLGAAWQSGNGDAAAAAIRAFSQQYSESLRVQSNVDRTNELAYRDWEKRVSEWLYGADHVTLRYSLEYDGLDITRLSPGSRGIVLLLLYLAIDEEETVPLIIDQPEENLDPESVYSELVDMFRKTSERRQVIMVTHNANLVVNTDVDQVIVASCGQLEFGKLPELQYLSGGLENPQIREAVCQVLEGGEQAFRERARRLRVRL